MCEHGRQRATCKECASPRAAGAGGAARKGAAEDRGYETATYVDEDATDYARPRKRRTVVKDEAADDDQGYDTATYVEGPNDARQVSRSKVKREEDRDHARLRWAGQRRGGRGREVRNYKQRCARDAFQLSFTGNNCKK